MHRRSGDVDARRGAGGLADHDYYSAFAAADHRIDQIDCESRGFGEWTGDGGEITQVQDEAESVTGYGFTCQGSGSNLFHDAAALDPAITLQWVVADGQAILMADAGNEAEWFAFYQQFRNWMRLTHADVADGMEFHTLPPNAFPTAESMATALEYVDEFVAASPYWPRPSGS